MNNVENHSTQTFEQLKQVDEHGNEFWYARPLSKILGYTDFRNFIKVVNKAIVACESSGNAVSDHIVEVNELIKSGKGATRTLPSYSLSRYACYLVVQNGDPTKPIIAAGQTYFAIQARRQELQNDSDFGQLKEDEKRLFLRNELKTHNKQLVEAASQAGVETHFDFAIFQNHGYKGLYGGLDAKGIHAKKGLKKSHKILDHMGSTELAANLFRATQTEEKLKRDQQSSTEPMGKYQANQIHNEVGKKVREAIESIGGTMPEELPTPNKSVLKIAKEQAKLGEQDND
ncbi:MAG: DNA damage-inducible protein D [Gammaproteobacteria bacterium]|nr:DNA damage-inducible protein D [Gammaproteobacteria bacterium]